MVEPVARYLFAGSILDLDSIPYLNGLNPAMAGANRQT